MWSRLALLMAVAVFLLLPAEKAEAATCLPPPSGLISWWPGDGNISDIVDNNEPSDQSGVSFVGGNVDQGLTVAPGGFIDVADNTNLKPQTFTIDTWVKPKAPSTTVDSAGDNVFVKDRSLSFPQASYALSWSSVDNKWNVLLGHTDSSTTNFRSAGTSPPDIFYFVAVTYDGTLKLYVDGTLDSELVVCWLSA